MKLEVAAPLFRADRLRARFAKLTRAGPHRYSLSDTHHQKAADVQKSFTESGKG